MSKFFFLVLVKLPPQPPHSPSAIMPWGMGMSKLEDFYRPEKLLEKTREIDNEARISKKAEMKRKFNRNQKRITP